MFAHQTIAGQLAAIRDELDEAEATHAIGHILVALEQLVDIVETLADRARYDDIQREHAD